MTGPVEEMAAIVDEAALNATAITQLSEAHEFDLDTAYRVQFASVLRRLARGERRVGVKMGFTSRVKMVQMGLSDMIFGRLTDTMLVEDGGVIDLSSYVHPRAEPEIAFLLKSRLVGPVSPAEAMAAVEAVAPAIEIIDSRYENFRFTLADVVADNTSSSGFVVGPWCAPDTPLDNLGIVLAFDGRPVQISSSAAVLGHPARALAAAARMSSAAGEPLEAGWIVMSGGATAAEALRPGVHVRASIEKLGNCGFSVQCREG